MENFGLAVFIGLGLLIVSNPLLVLQLIVGLIALAILYYLASWVCAIPIIILRLLKGEIVFEQFN